MEVTNLYPTEFDPTTQVMLSTLDLIGIRDEQIFFVQSMMLPELIAGRLRDTVDDEDFEKNIVPVLDLIFLGLLVREFIPREEGGYGYRDRKNPTNAALRGALVTAHWAGTTEDDLQQSARDVFRMLNEVANEKQTRADGALSLDVELLKIMLTGMILHRHIPIEEIETDE